MMHMAHVINRSRRRLPLYHFTCRNLGVSQSPSHQSLEINNLSPFRSDRDLTSSSQLSLRLLYHHSWSIHTKTIIAPFCDMTPTVEDGNPGKRQSKS